MKLPRPNEKRVAIYLSEETYEKAMQRYRNLDAKIEQLLRNEIEREELADAAHGLGHPGMSGDTSAIDPATPASSIPAPGSSGNSASFFETNPEAGQEPGVFERQSKRDRLPVLKPKRRKLY